MIKPEDKQTVLKLISEACESGARKSQAAKLLGLTIRTLQRWENKGLGDNRKGSSRCPANKLSDDEQQQVINILESPEFAEANPNQIVPRLADQGIYIGSESTLYRILKNTKMNKHRQASRPSQENCPDPLMAMTSNQIWTWDITYLPSRIKGQFYYLYMVMDMYSRKAVAYQVYDVESGEFAADLITDACIRENISRDQIILHSDNGSPMKSVTMVAKLQDLGVMPSFSRPSVSNDNPYSESLFRTLKYRPEFPEKPFYNIDQARDWVSRFINWYNTVHLHSGIQFVTPDDRHKGKDVEILANRHRVYQKARLKNPERWSGRTRNWKPVKQVVLKKYKRLKANEDTRKAA